MTIDVVTVVGRRDEPLLTIAARQLAQAASEAGCDLCAPTKMATALRAAPCKCCGQDVTQEVSGVVLLLGATLLVHLVRRYVRCKGLSLKPPLVTRRALQQHYLLRRPLLVCIGMKQHSNAGVRSVISQMLEHPVW